MKKETLKNGKEYYLFDCAQDTLGRVASRSARVLMGKHKRTYAPHENGGDFAVAVNVQRIRYSGRKGKNKTYHFFSGYPGGVRTVALQEQMAKDPKKVLRAAVYNMLPKNKLRDKMIKRLLMFEGAEHGLKAEMKSAVK